MLLDIVMPRGDISVTKHGLKIPVDTQNYAAFAARMKRQEQAFTSEFYAAYGDRVSSGSRS